jgi:predicted nucleic acid-binding protein
MGARHVFVETNWVVDCFAPAHFETPSARDLLRLAREGALSLHVPSICLSEARTVIRRKFQPRNQADPLRKYLRWAKENGEIELRAEEVVRQSLDRYERIISAALDALETTIGGLKNESGVEVFHLTESMLELALSLGTEKLELGPFDHVILPAVLTRAAEVRQQYSEAELFFCELDGDLQPWDRNGHIRPALAQLYDDAHIWVYGDFEMTAPARPDAWPK